MRALLLRDEAGLAENLARQLTIYATGSGHRFSDRAEIKAISQRSQKAGYGIRTLIENVVTSPLFLEIEP